MINEVKLFATIMYEVIALCICTSCLSCICCFVTGALCAIPKLLQIRKDLDACKKTGKIHNNGIFVDGKKVCHESANLEKKIICKCPKKIIIHTLPIVEESTCGLKKRDGCSCSPMKLDEHFNWK